MKIMWKNATVSVPSRKNGWYTAVNSKGKRGLAPASLLQQVDDVDDESSAHDDDDDVSDDVDVTVTEDSEDDEAPVSTRSKTPRT